MLRCSGAGETMSLPGERGERSSLDQSFFDRLQLLANVAQPVGKPGIELGPGNSSLEHLLTADCIGSQCMGRQGADFVFVMVADAPAVGAAFGRFGLSDHEKFFEILQAGQKR